MHALVLSVTFAGEKTDVPNSFTVKILSIMLEIKLRL